MGERVVTLGSRYRLANKGLRRAQELRRDHGDSSLADLLASLATELQDTLGDLRGAHVYNDIVAASKVKRKAVA
jgi:hypothetical protein